MLAASLDEAEGEEFVEECPIALFGPLSVEVGHRLEGAEACVVEPALEAAPRALALLDLEEAASQGSLMSASALASSP